MGHTKVRKQIRKIIERRQKTMLKSIKVIICFFLTLSLFFGSVNVVANVSESGDLHSATPTDITTGIMNNEEVLVYPVLTESSTASTTQYKNILVPITVNVADVDYLSFEIVLDTEESANTFLSFYAIPAAQQGQVVVTDYFDKDQSLYTSLEPTDTNTSGEIILYCGFNTTDTYTVARGAISIVFNGGFTNDGNGIPVTNTTAVTCATVLMGDVGRNGWVTSGDPSDIYHLIDYGSYNPDWGDFNSPTNLHRLAGDVDGDGEITYDDADLITEYVNGTLLSFWGTDSIAQLPTTPLTELTNNQIYHLKNQATGQYLYFRSDGSTSCMYSLSDNIPPNYSRNFRLRYGSGTPSLCTLQFGNGNYLQFDASDSLICKDDGSLVNFSSFWYIIPVNGGYHIVSYAKDTHWLGCANSSLKISREYSNNIWVLEPANLTANIKYYYDMCYYARKGSASVSSLQEYQGDVRDIFSDVFGITVTTAVPRLMQSYSDMCYSSINATNVEEWCTHGGGDTTQGHSACAEYCISPPIDAETNEIIIPASGELHHNNSSANLDHLYQTKQADTPVDIQFLMSGHSACGNEIDGTAHEYGNVGGLANRGERVAVVFNRDPDATYYKQIAMLHELSHCFGAGSAENSVADDGEEEGHTNCVMSYEDNKAVVYEAWENEDYWNLYCSSCRTEMKQYIMLNF